MSTDTGLIGSVTPFGSGLSIRVPKSVAWTPQEDITAHELALAMNVLLIFATGNAGYISYPEDHIARLPPNVQRHFKVS